jgi:hypothetical protein
MMNPTASFEREEKMPKNQTAKRESLWTRMMAAWARSFELLAESKARFPLEV